MPMSRRRYPSRPLRLESLEVRCNPAALVPTADFVAEPAPAQAGTHYFGGRFLRADDLMREQGSVDQGAVIRKGPVVDILYSAPGDSLATHELGHTIGLRHEHTRPASDVNGDGIDDIVVGAGAGAPGGHVKLVEGGTPTITITRTSGSGDAGGSRLGSLHYHILPSTAELESLLDDLARDVAEATATSGPGFAVLTVGGTSRLY